MENSKKKILIFLHKFPYPDQDSTKFRILNSIILPLKDYFNIEVFIITYEKIKERDLDYLKNIAPINFYIYPKWRFVLNIFLKCFSLRPFQTEMFFFKEIFNKFFEKAKESDCIYVHTIRLGKYIEKLPEELKQKVVLDYNDSISMHYLKGWKYYPLFLKIPILFEGTKLYFYEKKLFKIFNNFTIVSPIDKDFILRGINKEKISVKKFFVTYISAKILKINNIYITEMAKNNKPYICFMGNLKYYPNFEGLSHFLKDIWPPINSQFKELEFWIIGKVSSKLQNKFKYVKNIKFLGFLDNPIPIIRNSVAFISPVRIGAGIQGKILEIMGMGHLVISYSQGIEDINGIKDRRNIFICKNHTPEEWLNILKEIYKDKSLVKKVKENAYRLILEEFTSEKLFEVYLQIFKIVLKS
jgi:glycosyltransferase involved in cell wall biosynthesis